MMKSIDNLREWANGLHGTYINQVDHTITITTGWDAPPDMDSVSLRDHVNGILDGIEREVKELTDERDLLKRQWEAGVDFDQRLETCADNREDVTLWGVDYTPLPVDADGVPWHINDEFEVDEGIAHVNGIGDNRLFYIDGDGMQWTRADNKCHHHAPTVDDVLEEFVARWMETHHDDIPALKAEYAAKLALRGDE